MVRGNELFLVLFNNLAIFIALVALYSFILPRFKKLKWYNRQIIFGISFGLFAIGCMYARIPVYEGVIVDQRNAIVALSGAFGGGISAIVSAVFAGSFRAYLGGGGVLAGIIGVSLSALSGSLLHRYPKCFSSFSYASLSALFATIIILPGFLFVEDFATGWELLKAMSLPYGAAIFLGIFLGGLLLNREKRRYKVEQSYRESEKKYRVLFESFPLGVTISDPKGEIIETNHMINRSFTLPLIEPNHEETAGKRIIDNAGKEIPATEYPGIKALRENRKIENVEIAVQNSNQEFRWLNVTAAPIPLERYGVAVIYNDITDRKKTEIELKKALDEKNMLIQELYHRTRNNMQLIIALLDFQLVYVQDSHVKSILNETKNRIYSMSLVHQKLYQSKDLSHIQLNLYIKDLANLLLKSYQVEEGKVELHFNMEDIYVLIDIAIPCGLILEELISNILAHAFPGDKSGSVKIDVYRKADHVILSVTDNGVGLPKGFDTRTQGRVGLKTVFALAEHQLQAETSISNQEGVTFTMKFRDDLYTARV